MHARGGAATWPWHYGAQEVIYLFGGCSEVTCFDDLMRHDQHSQRWASQPARGKAPTRRKGHSMTLLGPSWAQQLVVFGGWSGDSPTPNNLKAYTINTNTWEVLSVSGTPPSARWAHTATAVGRHPSGTWPFVEASSIACSMCAEATQQLAQQGLRYTPHVPMHMIMRNR